VQDQNDWVAVAPPDGQVNFLINAADNGTPQTTKSLNIQFTVCETGMRWDNEYGLCQGPVVIDPIPQLGVDEGGTFSYQVTATDPGNGAISYSLIDQPSGMSIDDNGVITWKAAIDPNVGESLGFTVAASDAQGRQTVQVANLNVCVVAAHCNSDIQGCE